MDGFITAPRPAGTPDDPPGGCGPAWERPGAGPAPAARAGFEGSYLGDAARLPADARLECKICWWVYDPALGDPVWQIEPGIPFTALPTHWRCPQCDGAAEQFMVLVDEA